LASKTWKTRPVDSFILEVLNRKGAMPDSDLLELVTEEFNDIGLADVNRLLMNLEIEGKIYVSNLTKGKRRVELRAAKQ
jgi:Fe2+ or Zn2+ uptake regulation protein